MPQFSNEDSREDNGRLTDSRRVDPARRPIASTIHCNMQRLQRDCERFCFRVLVVVTLVIFCLGALFLFAVWSLLSLILGQSGSANRIVGSGSGPPLRISPARWQSLDGWMKARMTDSTTEQLARKMEFRNLEDLLTVAYDDPNVGPESEETWRRLSRKERLLLRAAARRLWDEVLAESWLRDNDLHDLEASFQESGIFTLAGILRFVQKGTDARKDADERPTLTSASTLKVSSKSRTSTSFINTLNQRPKLRINLFVTVAQFQAHLLDDGNFSGQDLSRKTSADDDIDGDNNHDDDDNFDVGSDAEAFPVRGLAAYTRGKWRLYMSNKSQKKGWEWTISLIVVFAGSVFLACPWLGRYFKGRVPLDGDADDDRFESPLIPSLPPSARLLDVLTLKYPSIASSSVEWEFENPARVGKTVSFRIIVNSYRGTPFSVDENNIKDWVVIGVEADDTRVLHTTTFSTSPTPTSTPSSTPASTPSDGGSPVDSLDIRSLPSASNREELPPNVIRVSFTVHKAATYKITVKIAQSHMRGSPFHRVFQPGLLDVVRTGLCQQSPLLTCSIGTALDFGIQPRDNYNNKCTSDDIDGSFFSLSTCPVSSNSPNQSEEFLPIYSLFERNSCRLNITVFPSKKGIFHVKLMYLTQPLVNCTFNLIVLSPIHLKVLETNILNKKHNLWFEARILEFSQSSRKPRKVYIYVSPRQVTIKEFFLKIIPKRLFTFRVCPSTKIDFKLSQQYGNAEIFSIDDGTVAIDLTSQDRDKFVATYTRILLNNIGGSETFQDKREFFHTELLKHHKHQERGSLHVRVNRNPSLWESAYKALRNASTDDWAKLFQFTFEGEEGLDYGGLRREAFNEMFKFVFQSESGLFNRLSEDQHGSVHPAAANRRPSSIKPKHFEFVGKLVGKCLFESSVGLAYALNVNARLSRSFLAQLIGLRVTYKYFEQDDPQFYVTKVKYILENDLDNAELAAETGLDELTFSEEVYDNRGQLSQVIDLIPNGRNIRVTNSNKREYLDLLAQHRFVNAVSAEIEAFLKGLNELIPDSLLCMFDERELELLFCGTGTIDIDDFRKHTTICTSSSIMFPRCVEWFWTVVSSFGQDELALLLQFVTGSSQLPPQGFVELRPQFQISHSSTAYNSLPMAHTCFNQLCLPDYEDCATLHRLLLLALHEGSQGFGFA